MRVRVRTPANDGESTLSVSMQSHREIPRISNIEFFEFHDARVGTSDPDTTIEPAIRDIYAHVSSPHIRAIMALCVVVPVTVVHVAERVRIHGGAGARVDGKPPNGLPASIFAT